jgi:hypothetical protein
VQIPPTPPALPLTFNPIHLSTGLAAVNEACYFSAHEHALRNPSRRGQTAASGKEILLEHLVRKLGVRPTITEGSRAQRERWLQKLDRLRTRGATDKRGAPFLEIFDNIRAERLLMSYWDSSALVKLYVQELGDSAQFRELGGKDKPCGDWVAHAA